MAASTDIKWFKFDNKNAPIIENKWGCIIPLLDTCLVTGFVKEVVKNISIEGKIATLSFEQPTLFSLYQVITIEGSDLEDLNNVFRIISISEDTKQLSIELPVKTSSSNTSTLVTAHLTSLGWEKSFEGIGKAAYRSNNESLNTRPYLRVLDSHPEGFGNASNNYSKFARVGMVEEMTTIDNFSGVEAPYDPLLPNKNWETTIVGSSATTGWSRWFYALPNSSTGTLIAAPLEGIREWFLVGDSDRFFLINSPYTNSYSFYNNKFVYGFGAYESFVRNDISNTFLATSLSYLLNTASVNFGTYTSLTASSHNNILLLREYTQVAKYSTASLSSFDKISVTGNTDIVKSPDSYAMIIPFPCYIIDSSNVVRGRLPNYFWLGQTRPFLEKTFIINNKDEILMLFNALGSTSASMRDATLVLKIGEV